MALFRLAVKVALISTLVLYNQCQAISFQTEALSKKTKCEELTKNDCLFYHEAIDQCNDVCQQKIKGNDDEPKKKPDDDKPEPKEKGAGCFHGDALVMTNLGTRKMADLPLEQDVKIWSRNLKGEMTFSPVRYWMHSDGSRTVDFITLTTEQGHSLTLTPDHLIYETDCQGNAKNTKTIFAEKVKIGSCLIVEKDGRFVESKVTTRELSPKTGVYAPVTENGNLVVNGVLASSFCCVENEAVQKLIFGYLDGMVRASQKWLPDTWFRSIGENVAEPLELVFWFWDVSKSFIV